MRVRRPAAPGAFPLLAASAALLVGVTLALWLPPRVPWWLHMAALLSLPAWPLLRQRRHAVLVMALLLGWGLAGLHAAHAQAGQLPLAWENRECWVQGRVEGLPQVEPRRTRFSFVVEETDGPAALRGRRMQLAWYDDFGAQAIGPRAALQAGAGWRLRVRLRAPRGLANPGGFDAERHALANRVVATGLVRTPEQARPLRGARGIDAWRAGMSQRIAMAVPHPASRFVQALALGDTRALQDADWDTLRRAGLTHLIAISGFHVGIVAASAALLVRAVWLALPWLGRWWPRPLAAAVAALAGGAGYALLAGMSLPTLRTVLMIAVAVAVRLLRRRGSVAQALALALSAVLLFDPLSVLFAGFWLSFAGVAWLVWCMPTYGGSPWRGFLSAQGVATVGLVPLTVALFDQVSLLGPCVNLLAIPWWTLVVVPLALLGLLLDALVPGSGGWAWRLAAGCFDASWQLFSRLADSPLAAWWAPESGAAALLLALAGAFWLLMPRGTPGRWLGVVLWLPLCVPDMQLPRAGELDVQVLDVGQGLAVLVRTERHALLYDAGPAVPDGFDAGERVVVPALRALGVRRLDAMVLSHADADHAGGFAAVARAFPTGRSLAPPAAPLPVLQRCRAGQRWEWDGMVFRFLHPGAGFPYLRNESSCVLRIESAHGAVLLAGDIGEVIESRLLRDARADLRADVVLVPHHGSAGSSQPGFIAASGARLALVSAGHANRFGHPRRDVVARWRLAGAEVLTTADSGAIRVWLGRGGLQVRERRAWAGRRWDAAERARAAAILSADEHAAGAPEG